MTNKQRFLMILALSSASAYAGFKNTHYVTKTVSGTVESVYGAMGTARNSADSLQYIGCEFIASLSHEQILCSARTAGQQFLGCISTDPRFLRAASTLTDGALIQYSVDSSISTYECSYIHIAAASRYAPPAP